MRAWDDGRKDRAAGVRQDTKACSVDMKYSIWFELRNIVSDPL